MRILAALLIFKILIINTIGGQSLHDLPYGTTTLLTNQTVSVTDLNISRSGHSSVKGSCIPSLQHSNNAWFKWIAPVSGQVAMGIVPFNLNNDIDFVIFKLDEKTNNLIEVRCSAAGPVINKPKLPFNCNGGTGLHEISSKKQAAAGCFNILNNYLENIDATENEIYYIQVINFGSQEGFDITLMMDEILNVSHSAEVKLLSWTIYPNPVLSNISIYISHDLRPAAEEVKIYDSLGRYIKSHQITKGVNDQIEIDASTLSTGIYSIILYTPGAIYSKKIIKL